MTSVRELYAKEMGQSDGEGEGVLVIVRLGGVKAEIFIYFSMIELWSFSALISD